jgi:hypothetical protein
MLSDLSSPPGSALVKAKGSFSISLLLLLVVFFSPALQCAESLDFVAEHILEVPMDLRYLSFPKTPVDSDRSRIEIQAGYGEVSGGRLTSGFPMLSVNYFTPRPGSTGLLFSFFYDRFQYSGSRGLAELHPSFGTPDDLPHTFQVDVSKVSGSGFHAGLSGAYVRQLSSGSKLQFGFAYEQLNIGRFRVRFRSVGLSNNFDGSVDYASRYNIYTPFIIYERGWNTLIKGWQGQLSTVIALPLPRVGFRGRFQGPGFDFDSDTDAQGKGRVIPDAYLGVGYAIEHRASRVRVDFGATLFSYLTEPLIHRGANVPIFISVAKYW